jgi:hypothetical protein
MNLFFFLEKQRIRQFDKPEEAEQEELGYMFGNMRSVMS